MRKRLGIDKKTDGKTPGGTGLEKIVKNGDRDTNVLSNTQSGLKKTGYLLADVVDVLYKSYIEPIATMKIIHKDYRDKRREYRKSIETKFLQSNYNPKVAKFLSHIAPLPIADKSKGTFAYSLGIFVLGGFQEWVLDAFAHALHLDKKKIIKGSIYGEYFNNVVSSIQIFALLKAGTFIEEYLGNWAAQVVPNFLENLSSEQVWLISGAYALGRYSITTARHKIYKTSGRYTTSPMRYITPSTVYPALIATGLTWFSKLKNNKNSHNDAMPFN